MVTKTLSSETFSASQSSILPTVRDWLDRDACIFFLLYKRDARRRRLFLSHVSLVEGTFPLFLLMGWMDEGNYEISSFVLFYL